MADGVPPPPRPPGPAALSPATKPTIPPPSPLQAPSGLKKETMRLTPPAKPNLSGAPSLPKPPVPAVPAGVPALPKPLIPPSPAAPKPVVAPSSGSGDILSGPAVPGLPKSPVDLRKETMRISLPPRPGGPGGKSPSAGDSVSLPAAGNKPTGSGPASGAKPSHPTSGPAGVSKGSPGVGIGKPTTPTPAGVRAVVDPDSSGTALAIAALVAALISFGVVLTSFLAK